MCARFMMCLFIFPSGPIHLNHCLDDLRTHSPYIMISAYRMCYTQRHFGKLFCINTIYHDYQLTINVI